MGGDIISSLWKLWYKTESIKYLQRKIPENIYLYAIKLKRSKTTSAINHNMSEQDRLEV